MKMSTKVIITLASRTGCIYISDRDLTAWLDPRICVTPLERDAYHVLRILLEEQSDQSWQFEVRGVDLIDPPTALISAFLILVRLLFINKTYVLHKQHRRQGGRRKATSVYNLMVTHHQIPEIQLQTIRWIVLNVSNLSPYKIELSDVQAERPVVVQSMDSKFESNN